MRILWVSTSPMGPASRILNMQQPGSSGGWIQSEYEDLIKNQSNDVEMFFLCGSRSVKKGTFVTCQSDEGTAFCVNLPKISFGIELPTKILENIEQIISDVKPDLIHIWGTESCISYGTVKASPGIKKVVFLQGLIGVHQRYKGGYLYNMNEDREYSGGVSLKKNLLAKTRKMYFVNQIKFEQYIIKNCQGVIIDNDFSAAYCRTISKGIKCFYRFLNPNRIFYDEKWNYDSCNHNTIFTVFGQSPEKGLHQLLKALSVIKKQIPDIKLIVPGPFSSINGKLKERKHLTMYELWLSNYIKFNNLEENVEFVGKLTPAEMVQNVKNCNVFVNPSCMEVHALSLREAMTLGTPCITSLCGSVIEFVIHNENGLIYRYEEYEMLAFLIEKVLEDKEFSQKIASNARNSMYARSNIKNHYLIEIYNEVSIAD